MNVIWKFLYCSILPEIWINEGSITSNIRDIIIFYSFIVYKYNAGYNKRLYSR